MSLQGSTIQMKWVRNQFRGRKYWYVFTYCFCPFHCYV